MSLLFDELRGAVLDAPQGRMLPGWVSKAVVIEIIDDIEAEVEDKYAALVEENAKLRRAVQILQENWPKNVPAPMDSKR